MRKPGAGNREPGTARPRMLIADDEQSMREWMSLLFKGEGYEVFTAHDGVAAKELLASEYIDLVLTDIRMPRLGGVELLKAVKEMAPETIVMMMTAHFTQDSEDWSHARNLRRDRAVGKAIR